jgi:hypothetical protein
MKLANSWVEDASITIPGKALYDEVEELDEGDEAEDGCGGVVWRPYVLTKANSSNKMLHELGREIRGTEKQRGKRLGAMVYKAIFHKWESVSRSFLRPGYDYFTEFLAKLDCVTVPKGQTLRGAFERAKHREPPARVLVVTNRGLRLLASLCRELQEMAGDEPFMLCQASVAKLFTHSCQQTISNWIRALKTVGVLKLAEAAIPNARAARYFYLER